jgi:PAS domain S-box-containing protein
MSENEKKEVILIVNDTLDQLEMMEVIFSQACYEVITAADGEEGLRKALENPVDLIISDVMMPVCDGIEFCRAVRSRAELRYLPFLLVSALCREMEKVVEGLRIGADDYIEMPVDPLYLVARVARLLERSRAEDARRINENYFRSLLENVSDIITIRSLEGEIYYESPSLEQVLGYKPEELIGKNTFDYVHPEDKRKLIESLEAAARDYEKTPPIEYRYLDKRGRWRTLESIGKVVHDPQRGPVAVINHRDVTERRLIERALRQSEERFRSQYKGIPLPTYTWRKTGDDFVLTDYNTAAEKISNGGTSRYLRMTASEMYPDIPELVELMERCYREQSVISRQMEYRFRVGGHVRFLEVSFVFVPPDIVMVHTRDITEEREAKIALEKSEQQFRKVLANSRDAVYQINLESKSFDYVSPAVKQITGYEPQRFLSEGFAFGNALVHPDDLRTIEQSVSEAIRSSDPGRVAYDLEYRLKTREKGYRWISEKRTIARDETGRARAIIAVARDVTEDKEVEEKLHFQNSLLESQSEASLDGILVVGASGEILYWNKFFHDLLKISDSILAERNIQKVWRSVCETLAKPADFLQMLEYLEQFPLVKDQVDLELIDGDVLECYTAPVENKEKLSEGRIWYFRDVTRRRKIETALQESEDRYRDLVENSHDLICTHDLEGRILSANQTAVNILGYEQAELLKGKIQDLLDESHRDQFEPYIAQIKEHGQARGLMRVKSRRGETRIWEFRNTLRHLDVDEPVVRGVATDVTERKRASKLLRESEEKYRIVAETATDGIITIDRRSTILFVNASAEKIFGYTTEEMLGANLTMLMPDYLRKLHQNSLDQYVDQGRRHINWRGTELQGLKKNGEAVDIEVSFGESKSGDSHYFTGIIRDITERKLAEQKLIESEKQYRFVAEAMPQQIWTATPDGTIDYVNTRCYDYFGVSPENPAGIGWQQVVHPEDLAASIKNWTKSLATGDVYETEFRLKNAAGVYRWHLGRATAMLNEKGEISKWFGTNTDIDDLKQAEAIVAEGNLKALQDYEELLQRVSSLAQRIGAAPEISAIFTAILDFARNSAPCSALVISLLDEQDETRRPVYAWYHGAEMNVSGLAPFPVGDGNVGRAIKSGEVIIDNDYLQTLRKRGVMIRYGFDVDDREPCSAMFAPMKIEGRTVGVIEIQSYEPSAYGTDHLTAMRMAANLAANAIENVRLRELERKQSEQLRQAQKLESVGRLAGGIAHDFNNMLTAINGYSEITLRNLEQVDPLRRNLEEIKKAGERSAALTQQLLAFSRQQILQPTVLDLNGVILDTIKMLQRLIGEDIQIHTGFHPTLGLINGDAAQLSQVIMNLTVNARDAMPGGGELTIETDNVYLDEKFAERYFPTQPGHYVKLTVADTGTGISPNVQQHIFEPFFTTKEVGKGTGLGLATVYGIIKQSGGYIWLDQARKVGTKFDIYLPRIDGAVRRAETPVEPAAVSRGSETILIVEDEEMVRSLAREILVDCGYRVIEAKSGPEALSITENLDEKVDLLLTDIVMPQMSGRELANILKKKSAHLRILLMSGYSTESFDQDDLFDADANFIHKPFTFIELAEKVRSCLDG